MSAAAAAAAEATPSKAGKKKLIIIVIAAVLALTVLGGGAAVFMMKKNAAEAAAAEDAEESEDGKTAAPSDRKAARDPAKPPTFVALDPFTVNLADREAERYAQVGITLEIADPAVEAQIKAMLPVIRNNILLAISDATAADLMGREGKTLLARRIQRETSRALGVELKGEADNAATLDKTAPTTGRKRRGEPALPITAVHFSNFIIQ
jgi:flagellar FliL protein